MLAMRLEAFSEELQPFSVPEPGRRGVFRLWQGRARGGRNSCGFQAVSSLPKMLGGWSEAGSLLRMCLDCA